MHYSLPIFRRDYLILVYLPHRLSSSLGGSNTENYGENCADLLQLQYGGEGGVIDQDSFKHESTELRCYLSVHCRSLSMLQVIHTLTTNTAWHVLYPNFSKLAEILFYQSTLLVVKEHFLQCAELKLAFTVKWKTKH